MKDIPGIYGRQDNNMQDPTKRQTWEEGIQNTLQSIYNTHIYIYIVDKERKKT
jgi:hypothetical protein